MVQNAKYYHPGPIKPKRADEAPLEMLQSLHLSFHCFQGRPFHSILSRRDGCCSCRSFFLSPISLTSIVPISHLSHFLSAFQCSISFGGEQKKLSCISWVILSFFLLLLSLYLCMLFLIILSLFLSLILHLS